MSWFMLDVESDGPIPGDYSMICFGAVLIRPVHLELTYYGELKPISEKWVPEALAVSGFTREQTMGFKDPKEVMMSFGEWVYKNSVGRPMFVSDNNGYDFLFMHWYFVHFTGSDPFGYSSTNLGSLYKGLTKDTKQNFKHLRKTRHDHNPVHDCLGNAEALMHMRDKMGLKIDL